MNLLDWQQRHLVGNLLRRRIEARYRGSVLGLAWTVLLPLAMLGVYTLVFSHFLKIRWPGAVAGDGLVTALNIYLGLIVFNYAAENLSGASNLVVEHQSYVKKIVFPLPILAHVAALASLVPLVLGLGILAAFAQFAPEARPVRLLALPVYWLSLPLWALALNWWLAAFGVYLRDINHLMSPATTALLFLSPVFYAVDILPAPWNVWFWLNPLTQPIEDARALLFAPAWPNPLPALGGCLAALLSAVAGRWVFDRLKKGFADVL